MKIYLDSIGCRLNQSEIERYASQFRAAGHNIVAAPAEADLVVVNTCAVTTEAASDSRQKVRQAARAGSAHIVITGCWSTLNPQDALDLPGVRRVVPNADKDALVVDVLDLPHEAFDLDPLAREPLPGMHLRTRAFIKAQDGCDNFCTFCITRVARGKSRSRPVEQVLADVRAAVEGGAKEVVLTGVQLGGWGKDFERTQSLYDLVAAVLERGEVQRLRLSSLEPWDLDARFFTLWQDGRMCHHLHLPLQSGSAATLKRMARKITPGEYRQLVEVLRAAVPDVALTTDLIVGFPGETPADYNESLDFIQAMDFAGGHVFTYSARPGTPAARYPGQVAHAERKRRGALLRQSLLESAARYQAGFIGQTLDVLWEAADGLTPDGWRVSGLTGNYLRVRALAPRAATTDGLWNTLSAARLVAAQGDGLWGELVSE